jgi:hypothetical protein
MPQRKLYGVAFIVSLALIAAGWHTFAAEERETGEDEPRAANAKARLEAAKKVYESTWQHHVQDPEAVPFNLDYYHDWSVRWLQAERDLSRTKAEQMAALEAHSRRMKSWKIKIARGVKEGTVPGYQDTAAEFFCLEAEEWLVAAKAEQK